MWVRETTDSCLYRGAIPTLEESKCACMHGHKSEASQGLGGLGGSLASPRKGNKLTSVSLTADICYLYIFLRAQNNE